MRSTLRLLLCSLSLIALCAPAHRARAEEKAEPTKPKLGVGDEAPGIDVAHWIKGVVMKEKSSVGAFETITTWEPGTVYLLEFWATWCRPCVASMPHISKLQDKYPVEQFRAIGVTNQSLPKVYAFLQQTWEQDGLRHDERATYTLGADPDGSVRRDFFLAAGQRGIPCGFIIGKTGEIEWIGHPARCAPVVDQVIKGTWDRAAHLETLAERAEKQRRQREWMARYQPVRQAKSWEACWELLNEEGLDNPGLDRERAVVLIRGLKRVDEGYAIMSKSVDAAWENERALNELAWWLATEEYLQPRNLDLAMKAGQRAMELGEAKVPATLDTVARILFLQGKVAEAIELQKKALALTKPGRMREGMEAALREYEAQSETPAD